ncbi:MAG TPA: c-type cytochrome biogenesis protein CcmI [Casimicrobiaceae bacterium]|nr:c-type cytochrome biogenesis protein CcmI [Casimicrobiaceae bacterium]
MPIVPLFWIVALLLVAAVLAAIVWPLLRGSAGDRSGGEASAATSVYRDQKRQLEDEYAAGAISAEERDAAIDELATRLSAELEQAPAQAAKATAAAPSRARFVWALALVFALPATAIVLYAMFGDPEAMRASSAPPQGPMSESQVTAMVEKLAAHMKEHPEDATGWKLLGRSYSAMGRFRESADAFREAAARSPANATLLAEWADALGMANGQSLAGEPTRLIQRALAIDANNSKALSLAASAALERNDYASAIESLEKLKPQFPPGSEQAKEIDQVIAQAKAAQAGGAPSAAGAAGAAAPTPQADVAAGAITGRVSIDPALAGRVAPGDTLYIFARAVDGPRMPLAAIKASADSLPREFTLDDSMAMAASARLSTAGQVVVEARISKSGLATPSPGDLRGVSAPVRPGTHGVSIVIGEVVR